MKDIGSSRTGSGTGATTPGQKAAGIEAALGGNANDASVTGPRSEKTGLLTDSTTGTFQLMHAYTVVAKMFSATIRDKSFGRKISSKISQLHCLK